MIILIIWDGLRPDMITAERTPFLHRMSSQGVFCRASHAVFPTATRINSASLTTGCYPGRHGIVDNGLYVPAIDSRKAISCANWQALQTMADLEGQRLLSVPTLGEVLHEAGKRMASAGSGSPGTTYLTNPTVTGPVVNWATAWPTRTQVEIRRRYGSFLGSESTSSERNAFILRAVHDYLIPDYSPDVLTVWLTEPDHTQHKHGLASPETTVTLAELDRQLEHFWDTLRRDSSGEEHTCLLLSDHGFSTVSKRIAPDQTLVTAGLKASPDSSDIIRDCNSLYLTRKARERLGAIVRVLLGEPWVGALFLRDDLLIECPEVMPQSAVFGDHRRSAELMFAYQWSPAENDHGVPGSVVSSSANAATHGSASPYDINNCLVAWGKGIVQATISTVPCGIIDVAPTVLDLLGIKPPAVMEGRVLHELLEGGPAPESVSVSHDTRESTFRTAAGPRHQVVWYSSVNGHRYLEQSTFTT